MARTIAPGNPTPIEPVNVNIPDIDLTIFDKYGDDKIKSATRNFQLYATTTANVEAQKAYQQYKNNPIALANALSKLPGIFNELPESVRAELKPKFDANAISLVTKAQANQQALINKQNKAMAHTNATLNMNQIADDYFNVLQYITAPDKEKRPVDLDIYRAHRAELNNLVNLTDENGTPLFNETTRAKMAMPKDAVVAGFKQFINRMESDQLKAWGENIFQNQTKFMEDTNIDADTYESLDTYYVKRLKALNDTSVRTMHGQAYYDQVNLIDNPTQVALEKAKAYEWTDDKALDKAVESAKAITQATYYDPTRRTAPTAFLMSYNMFSDTIKNNDWSPEGREQAIAQAFQALNKLKDFAQEANLPPETSDALLHMITKSLWDKEAQQALLDSGFGLDFAPSTIETLAHPGDAITATIFGNYSIEKGKQDAEKTAFENYTRNLERAVPYYNAGDYDNFKTAVANAHKQAMMDRAGYIVKDGYEWERLIREYNEGKKPIYNYLGRMLEFKGFDNKSAVFEETF